MISCFLSILLMNSLLLFNLMIVLCSSQTMNDMCVWGLIDGERNNIILGQYSYGGLDSNNNHYWYLEQNTQCYNKRTKTNKVYLYLSPSTNKWQLTWELSENCYYVRCTDSTFHSKPSECNNFHRLHIDLKENDGFRIMEGKCPSLQCNKFIASNYDGYWQGCNGEFHKIADNVYKRKDIYTGHSWGNLLYYWYFDQKYLRWKCAQTSKLDFDASNQANICHAWASHSKDGSDGTYLLDIDSNNNNNIKLLFNDATAQCIEML